MFQSRYAIRDWKAAALQICVPLVALAVGLSVIKFNIPQVRHHRSSRSLVTGTATAALTLLPRGPTPFLLHPQDGPVLPLDASSQFNALAGGGTVLPYGDTPPEARALAAQVGWGASPLVASSDAAWNPDALYGNCAELCGPKYANVVCDPVRGGFDPNNAANVTAAQLGMDQFLMAHARERAASTYGAFRLAATTNAELNVWELELWQNSTAAHGAPIVLHIVADALVRVANGGAQATASITTNFRPFSLTMTQTSQSAETSTFTSALIIVMAFAFIPVSFATFIVRERQLEVKHQQLISGVSITAYWASTFAFDIATYMIPCLGSIAMIAAFQISGWVEVETFAALCLLFLLYGISVAPFTYVASYGLKTPALAMTAIVGFNFIVTMLIIGCFVMSILEVSLLILWTVPGTCGRLWGARAADISCESCSQFDSLPRTNTSVRIRAKCRTR